MTVAVHRLFELCLRNCPYFKKGVMLFEKLASSALVKLGKAPEVPFVANDVTYKWGYYLTDGIYLEWAVLMKSISQLRSNDVKRIRYKQAP
ncbi:ALP1-like protein isoform X1 [Tanacetum coccineum]